MLSSIAPVERQVTDVYGFNRELSAGRPYLPCPDVTGDGLENREPIVTAVIDIRTTVLLGEGGCMEYKGLLPWRTLGMQQQTDPWGRRIGYRVDPMFSNEILGFDENFRADVFELRQAVTLNAGIEFFRMRANRNIAGALVCSESLKGNGCPGMTRINLLVGIIPVNDLVIGARIVKGFDRADYVGSGVPQSTIEGAVFTVYSHGPNGYGGINESNGCLAIPPNINDLAERSNAYYRAGSAMIMNFGCERITNNGLSESVFVSAPPSINAIDGSTDDTVMWASANYILGVLLEGGVLPIPKLPFIPD